jgi:hypothetical protein
MRPTIIDVVEAIAPVVIAVRRVWTFLVGPPKDKDADAA